MRAKKSKPKLFLCLLAVVFCMTAFTVPAFAGDDSWCEYGDYGTEDAGTTMPPSETETQDPATTAPETQNPSTAPAQEQTAKPSGNSTTATESKPQQSTAVTPAPADTTPAASDTPQKGQEDADPSGDGEVGKGTPLTPEGNLNLVDDVVQSSDGEASEPEEKQFIIVQSKNGNYFYIVIDRSGDKENVHFLNQVDEADLMALIEDGTVESEPLVCTCTDKCIPGDIDTSCPVCQVAMSECLGKEAEPEPTLDTDPEPEPEKDKAGSAGLLVIVLVVALAAGGAVYYFKFRKPKPDTKGPVDLDDYDFGEDEVDEADDFPIEPDDDETEEHNEGD